MRKFRSTDVLFESEKYAFSGSLLRHPDENMLKTNRFLRVSRLPLNCLCLYIIKNVASESYRLYKAQNYFQCGMARESLDQLMSCLNLRSTLVVVACCVIPMEIPYSRKQIDF